MVNGRRSVTTRLGRSSRSSTGSGDAKPELKDISFIYGNSTVETQPGNTVELDCYIRSPDDDITVFWWRRDKKTSDDQLISTNYSTVHIDQRFQVSKLENNWRLLIRLSQKKDEAIYACQIISEIGIKTIYINLILIEAYAEIIGPSVKVVKYGSPLRLSCILKRSLLAPKYIYWYHWDHVINYDLDDGASVRLGRQGSELIFPRAEIHHEGNYSCVPSNARQASVIVEVLHGEIVSPGGATSRTYRPMDITYGMLLLIWIYLPPIWQY